MDDENTHSRPWVYAIRIEICCPLRHLSSLFPLNVNVGSNRRIYATRRQQVALPSWGVNASNTTTIPVHDKHRGLSASPGSSSFCELKAQCGTRTYVRTAVRDAYSVSVRRKRFKSWSGLEFVFCNKLCCSMQTYPSVKRLPNFLFS